MHHGKNVFSIQLSKYCVKGFLYSALARSAREDVFAHISPLFSNLKVLVQASQAFLPDFKISNFSLLPYKSYFEINHEDEKKNPSQ